VLRFNVFIPNHEVKETNQNLPKLIKLIYIYHLDTKPGCDSVHECEINHVDEGGLWPDETSFNKYLPYFMVDNPCDVCAKGGHAAYGQVLIFPCVLGMFIIYVDRMLMGMNETSMPTQTWLSILKTILYFRASCTMELGMNWKWEPAISWLTTQFWKHLKISTLHWRRLASSLLTSRWCLAKTTLQ